MKSYEKALEALKAPASARNDLKTVIKRLKAFSEGKDLSGIFGGLDR